MNTLFCFVFKIMFLSIFNGFFVPYHVHANVNKKLLQNFDSKIDSLVSKRALARQEWPVLACAEGACCCSLRDNLGGSCAFCRMSNSSQQDVLFLPDALAPYSLIEEDYGDFALDTKQYEVRVASENDFIGVYAETFHDRDSSVLSNGSAIVTRNICFDAQKTLNFKIVSETSLEPKIVHEADLGKIVHAWRANS